MKLLEERLSKKCSEIPFASFPHHSRVHRLRSFGNSCYVKREDELGFGVSGTKLRKYLSLLPALLRANPQAAVLTGSAYSNHIVSFSQLLREQGIEPILLLLGDPGCKMQGNLLYSTLIAGMQNVQWVDRECWKDIDAIAKKVASERVNTVVVPKGANCQAALPGALTLALDLLQNERELGLTFDHIFIDSGTGMTASALILALAFLQRQTVVHVVQVAGNEAEFHRVLAERKKDFEELVGEPLLSPLHFQLYRPRVAPAFGSVNASLFKTIAHIAQTEGFLTDPVFTAKLFCEGKRILEEERLEGNLLFLHSGGTLSLSGFQDEVAKLV